MKYKNNKVKYIYTIILSISILLISFYTIAQQNKVSAKDKVIRVAYPIVEGFTELKDGVYSGYGYEYLREIAKFTGWKYEFVEVSLNESIQMLKDGELDIAGTMIKNSFTEEYYDFPEADAGSTYTTLSVLRSNTKISDSNYESMNNIRVGVYETAQGNIDKFEKFCENNNLEGVEIIKYQLLDGSELDKALSNGDVDGILGNDLLVNQDQKVALRFAPVPHYFATTEGNTDVLNKLNYAISRIRELEPDYNEKLYKKYFQKNMQYTLSLTKEEQEYIDQLDELRAVYLDDMAPIQNWNENNNKAEGIAIDIIQRIANDLDINIKLIKVKNYEEAFNAVNNNKADIFIATPSEYNITDKYGIHITKPYINMQTVGVVNKSAREDNKVIAIPKLYKVEGDYPLVKDFSKILEYDTMKECIDAVDKGIADFTFGNMYKVSSETQINYYNNINLKYDDKNLGEISIGVGDNASLKLLSIMNKAILSIQSDEVNKMLYDNVVRLEGKVGISAFVQSNLYLVISIIIIISTIIITLIYIILKLKLNNVHDLNEILKEKAEKDPLTGVYNCGMFEKLTTKYLLDNNNMFATLLIIDIDNFKAVNDKLGHNVGDSVIKDLATNLKYIFREDDIVGRLGGDEFEVFMTDINEDSIHDIADRAKKLCESMDKDVVSDNGLKVHISLSIGICVFKKDTTFPELYKKADTVLYEVKRNGKNNYIIKSID
ncbi:MAG: transporter substrate-binding domain-containing diguanylate cyclase [Peptostreptococcaceae bacterium]